MCGIPLPSLQNGNTNNGSWQRDSYLDENYVPTVYIPTDEQPGTVLVNSPPLPPPPQYYDAQYREVYDNRQRDPYRKNNTLLLTALIAILTVILVTCLFLVVKYTFLDRIWKDPQSSTVIAQSENNAPLDPPAAAEEPAQPAEAAPAPITPYTTPAKGESIIHDHDAGQQDGGGKDEPAPPQEDSGSEQKDTPETETDHYIIPYSNTRYLTENDLRGLSEWELKLARNEIYARHGRRFKDPALQEYFDAQSWYTGLYDPEDFDKNHSDELSDLEKWNAEFILQYEKDHGMMT